MANTIFPAANLPPQSVAWGRAIQTELQSNTRSHENLAQQVNNEARNTSGQLEVLSSQMQELTLGRATFSASADPVTYSHVGTSGQSQGPTIPLNLPGPYKGARKAIVTFSFGATTSGNTTLYLWPELLLNGATVWRQSANTTLGPGGSRPDAWTGAAVSNSASLLAPQGSILNLSLRFWFYDFQANTSLVTFDQLQATVMYQDLV